MAKRFLSIPQIVNLPSDPAGTHAGQMYFNTNTLSLKYYDGVEWHYFGSAGGSLPEGGSSGQILAKIDNTDFNAEWIDNYAEFTSIVKHNVMAAEPINKGQAVYISSSDGTNMLVSLASNSSESTSSKTLGIAAQGIAALSHGYVIDEGLLSGLDTSSATAGDPVWLGTFGNLIYGLANKPSAPAHLVYLGVVTRVHAINGEIFVKIQNGFELNELHNVSISSLNDNHIISYDSSTSLWKNQLLSTAIQEIDGELSGIDADLLDGEQGTYYLNTSSTAQTKAGDLTITGNLTVNGTTTTINSTTISIDDKNIELGSVGTPTDLTADSGGLVLKGDTDKTILWIDATESWTLSENIDLASGKILKINGSPVLSATDYSGNAATVTNGVYTIGSYSNPSWITDLAWSKITSTPTSLSGYGISDIGAAVTYLGLGNVENTALSTWAGTSNITTLGTITNGTWHGSIIEDSYIALSIARLASPTFTGTVILPETTSIGDVSSIEVGYLNGVTSAIQTQINNKLDSSTASTTYAPLNSPTFTGTVNFSSATVTGIDLLPSQTGNSGKYLTTNGTITSWGEMSGSVYSADAPASPSTGQIWIESDVDIIASGQAYYMRWFKTLIQSETTFNGTNSNGILLQYTAGYEEVYLNGVLLVRGIDYTATDGLTIVLTNSAAIGDVIEIISQNDFAVANVYTQSEINLLLSSKADTSSLATKANIASPTFTGIPAAPTASAGTNTTQLATTEFVRTEITNLVASAPSTLDTLNELATALGNDANFSTTVTNSLAAKAPLNSPTFTGTVIVPSPSSGTEAANKNYVDSVASGAGPSPFLLMGA